MEGEILNTYTIVSQAVAVTIEDPDAYLEAEPEIVLENEAGSLLFPQERVTRYTAFIDPLEVAGVDNTSNTGMNKIMPQTVLKNYFTSLAKQVLEWCCHHYLSIHLAGNSVEEQELV